MLRGGSREGLCPELTNGKTRIYEGSCEGFLDYRAAGGDRHRRHSGERRLGSNVDSSADLSAPGGGTSSGRRHSEGARPRDCGKQVLLGPLQSRREDVSAAESGGRYVAMLDERLRRGCRG